MNGRRVANQLLRLHNAVPIAVGLVVVTGIASLQATWPP